MRVAIAIGLAFGLGIGVACSQTDMCARRGGQWYDSVLDPRLPGSCVMPAVDVGNPCTEAAHCQAGYCGCSDPRAKDGALMTGDCPEFPPTKKDGWICAVTNGVAHPEGVRVEE
jgi:hypothetical protein